MKRYKVSINKAVRAESQLSIDSMIAQIVVFQGHGIVFNHDEQAFYFNADPSVIQGLHQMPWVKVLEEV